MDLVIIQNRQWTVSQPLRYNKVAVYLLSALYHHCVVCVCVCDIYSEEKRRPSPSPDQHKPRHAQSRNIGTSQQTERPSVRSPSAKVSVIVSLNFYFVVATVSSEPYVVNSRMHFRPSVHPSVTR